MKKGCSSSRGVSQDEEEKQQLIKEGFTPAQKALAQSPDGLLYREYFTGIPIIKVETFSGLPLKSLIPEFYLCDSKNPSI